MAANFLFIFLIVIFGNADMFAYYALKDVIRF